MALFPAKQNIQLIFYFSASHNNGGGWACHPYDNPHPLLLPSLPSSFSCPSLSFSPLPSLPSCLTCCWQQCPLLPSHSLLLCHVYVCTFLFHLFVLLLYALLPTTNKHVFFLCSLTLLIPAFPSMLACLQHLPLPAYKDRIWIGTRRGTVETAGVRSDQIAGMHLVQHAFSKTGRKGNIHTATLEAMSLCALSEKLKQAAWHFCAWADILSFST